jgi:phosphoesterase RecJ-like protein
MYGIFRHYKLRPSEKAARALYTGILFDTGGFRYSRTTPATFRTIADLVECGANPTTLYEQIYENNQLANFLLRVRMLASLEMHHQGRMLLMHLTPEMIRETGGSFAEGELNISIPLTVKGVQASVIIKQDVDGPLKVSMRTKGDINVSDIAIAHNGGGHKNASGYKSSLSREETYRQVLDDLAPFFSEKLQQ